YAPAVKERNIAAALKHPRFRLHRLDLRHDPADAIVDGAELVFHLAATPGLAKSWTDFDGYWTCNVQATQRLLDAIRRVGAPRRGNTYVADCVEATVAAAEAPPGEVYNVGGGEAASVWDILRRLERLAGRPARVRREPARAGDQRRTLADTAKLTAAVGWR